MTIPVVGQATVCPDEACGAEAVCIDRYDLDSEPEPVTVHWRVLCIRHHVYTLYL